jgi:hypothetical protein
VTSAVTREQVEDLIRLYGIRDRFALTRIMRAVDAYALAAARRQAALADYDIPCDPYDYVAPGDWDKDEQVTRCDTCAKVKKWRPNFHYDKDHPSRHKVTCKACLRNR